MSAGAARQGPDVLPLTRCSVLVQTRMGNPDRLVLPEGHQAHVLPLRRTAYICMAATYTSGLTKSDHEL